MLPQIQIAAHNTELTPTLRTYINSKFERISKHATRATSIHVTLNVEKLQQIAKAKLHIPHAEIYAEATSEDMYKTIDLLIDKIVKQLDKHREKHE